MTLRPCGGILILKGFDFTKSLLSYLPGKQRLQKWTRGCLAIVNSVCYRRYWAPEGPAQVAVIVLTFLLAILCTCVALSEWEKLDNYLC